MFIMIVGLYPKCDVYLTSGLSEIPEVHRLSRGVTCCTSDTLARLFSVLLRETKYIMGKPEVQ